MIKQKVIVMDNTEIDNDIVNNYENVVYIGAGEGVRITQNVLSQKKIYTDEVVDCVFVTAYHPSIGAICLHVFRADQGYNLYQHIKDFFGTYKPDVTTYAVGFTGGLFPTKEDFQKYGKIDNMTRQQYKDGLFALFRYDEGGYVLPQEDVDRIRSILNKDDLIYKINPIDKEHVDNLRIKMPPYRSCHMQYPGSMAGAFNTKHSFSERNIRMVNRWLGGIANSIDNLYLKANINFMVSYNDKSKKLEINKITLQEYTMVDEADKMDLLDDSNDVFRISEINITYAQYQQEKAKWKSLRDRDKNAGKEDGKRLHNSPSPSSISSSEKRKCQTRNSLSCNNAKATDLDVLAQSAYRQKVIENADERKPDIESFVKRFKSDNLASASTNKRPVRPPSPN